MCRSREWLNCLLVGPSGMLVMDGARVFLLARGEGWSMGQTSRALECVEDIWGGKARAQWEANSMSSCHRVFGCSTCTVGTGSTRHRKGPKNGVYPCTRILIHTHPSIQPFAMPACNRQGWCVSQCELLFSTILLHIYRVQKTFIHEAEITTIGLLIHCRVNVGWILIIFLSNEFDEAIPWRYNFIYYELLPFCLTVTDCMINRTLG